MKEEKKKILYCDLDGCIADFEKGMAEIAPNLYLGEGVDYEARSKQVDSICEKNDLIFHNLPTIHGGIEAVKQLMKHYEVYFLSTPMWNVPNSFAGKRIWIEKHFGKAAEKRLILTHRKDLNIGDYLIDDRTRNGAGEFTGEHIHFGTGNFLTWDGVLNYLMPKEKQFPAKISFYLNGAQELDVQASLPEISLELDNDVISDLVWNDIIIDFGDKFDSRKFYNIYDKSFLLSLEFKDVKPGEDKHFVMKAYICKIRRYEDYLSSVTLRITSIAIME